jgi:hypothetical protein
LRSEQLLGDSPLLLIIHPSRGVRAPP